MPPKGLHWIELGQWPPQMAITADKRAYNRWMKSKQGVDFKAFPIAGGGSTQLMTRNDIHGVLMLAVHMSDDWAENVCTIAHEAVHAARFLFDYVGEDAPGKETEAYLVEHIVRRALAVLEITPAIKPK